MDLRILKENFEKSLSRLSEAPNYSKYVTGDIKSKKDPNNYYFAFADKDMADAPDIQSYVTSQFEQNVPRWDTYSEAMQIFTDLESDDAADMGNRGSSGRTIFIAEVEPIAPYKIANLEASNLGTMTEAAPDYSKVDSILKGTYKSPAPQITPEIRKMANTLDTLVSRPYDHQKLEDILNALGPIEPRELMQVIDVMKRIGVFSLETDGGNNPSYNLEVRDINNYQKSSKGVALGWSNDHWVAG